MPNISTLPYASNFRLDFKGVTQPHLPLGSQMFRESVKQLLSAQFQQYTDPVQQKLLSQLSENFSTMPPEAITECERAAGANSCVTRLKQKMLHELDQKLATLFQLQAASDTDTSIREMQTALARKRLPALMVLRDTVADDVYLQTCLNEHIAVAEKQIARGDASQRPSQLHAELPNIITSLKAELSRCETRLKDIVTAKKNSTEAQLKSLVNAAIAENNSQRSVKKELMYQEMENRLNAINANGKAVETVEKVFTQQKALLQSLADKIANGGPPPPPSGNIPESIRSSLQMLHTVQGAMLSAVQCEAQSREASIPENAPCLQQILEKLRLAQQGLAEEQSAALDSERAAYNGTGVDDFILRIKRLFGAGKGWKTRTEHRFDQQQHAAAQQIYAREVTDLRNGYTKETQRLEAINDELHQKVIKLHKQDAQQRTTLLGDIAKEMENVHNAITTEIKTQYDTYGLIRESIVVREDKLEEDIRVLEEDNKRLKNMLTGEFFTHIPDLRKRLAGKPALSVFEQHHTQWQEVISGDYPLRAYTRSLSQFITRSSMLNTNLNRFGEAFCRDDIIAIEKGLPQFGIDTKGSASADLQSLLTDAGSLYSMLCVEKAQAHPLLQEIQKADAVTPRTQELLSSLENVINRHRVVPENGYRQYRQGQSPAEMCVKINNLIQGLQRFIGCDLQEILHSAADFTAQIYHPEKQIYIDRQGPHGTCTMHSWNNLIAYITDNQKMLLTPWRTEKLIQSLVIQDAHIKLEDLLAKSPLPSMATIHATLGQIIRTSELITVSGYESVMARGYVMEHQDDTHLKIEHNHLKVISPRIFSLMGIRNETVAQYVGLGIDDSNKTAALTKLINKNFDAISIGFRGNASGSSHALALLKQGRDYLLVDSNYNDPIPLTLSQLTDFFTTGSSKSTILDELMQKRNYPKYKNLRFHFGLYKSEDR